MNCEFERSDPICGNDTGSQATLTDSKNQTTTWAYNLRGQLLTKTYPNGDDHAYTYDTLGRMATHVTPKNETCTYSYDLRDRPILSDWNSTTPDTTKTYWADGLLKSIDNGVSKSDYAYNARHDLTSETQTLTGRPARTVSYSYDADGLRGGTTYPSAKTATGSVPNNRHSDYLVDDIFFEHFPQAFDSSCCLKWPERMNTLENNIRL